jgi:hypothetical protein
MPHLFLLQISHQSCQNQLLRDCKATSDVRRADAASLSDPQARRTPGTRLSCQTSYQIYEQSFPTTMARDRSCPSGDSEDDTTFESPGYQWRRPMGLTSRDCCVNIQLSVQLQTTFETKACIIPRTQQYSTSRSASTKFKSQEISIAKYLRQAQRSRKSHTLPHLHFSSN